MDIRRILVFIVLSGLILLGWNRLIVQPNLEHQKNVAARQRLAAKEEAERKERAAREAAGA